MDAQLEATVPNPRAKTHRNIYYGNQQWDDAVTLAGHLGYASVSEMLRDILEAHLTESRDELVAARAAAMARPVPTIAAGGR